jgi:transposase
MSRPICSESEIRNILRRVAAGEDRDALLHRYGVSKMTFYRWRRQFHDVGEGQGRNQPSIDKSVT